MSARRSRTARHTRGPAFDPYAQPRRPQDVRVEDDEAGLPDGLRGSVPAAALLPLRFFLGAMFLYAGLDKLLDPAFLRPDGPGSIGFQLQEFARISPLSPLVTIFAQPFPVLTGLGISLLEIAIGLGAIFGLLYRWSAVAGAGLSILFFLTASWTTRPYYLGPDLPYALGWITLAAAGSGGVLTVESWLARRESQAVATRPVWAGAARWEDPTDPGRRAILQLGILATASVAIAGIGRWFSRDAPVAAATDPNSNMIASTATAPPRSVATGPTAATSAAPSAPADAVQGVLLGTLDQVPVGQARRFQVRSSGDPGVIVRLPDGSVAAYDAVCTHAGCTVRYDRASGLLLCPCHGAAFDPGNHAQVVGGPTDVPLPELPIKIDKSTGKIYLQA